MTMTIESIAILTPGPQVHCEREGHICRCDDGHQRESLWQHGVAGACCAVQGAKPLPGNVPGVLRGAQRTKG